MSETGYKISELGRRAVEVLNNPTTDTLGAFQEAVEAQNDATIARLRAQLAAAREALEDIRDKSASDMAIAAARTVLAALDSPEEG